jgi:CDP-glycerol glycerophosphotransferase (TagB/SpsB family)
LSIAFAFYPYGQVTSEIDYADLEIYPPEIECDEPAVKGNIDNNKCLPKLRVRLIYSFTKDQIVIAKVLFYNIFNEIMGEADIEETLRWEEDHIDVVDFIYIYPEFDFSAVKNSHHMEWEIHEQNKDESAPNN